MINNKASCDNDESEKTWELRLLKDKTVFIQEGDSKKPGYFVFSVADVTIFVIFLLLSRKLCHLCSAALPRERARQPEATDLGVEFWW